jgi:hypothetical protein
MRLQGRSNSEEGSEGENSIIFAGLLSCDGERRRG